MDLLTNCQNKAHQFFTNLLLSAEKSLNESLFDHAKASSSNEEQQCFYDAIQQLKSRSDAMHASFQQELKTSFQTFVNTQASDDNAAEQITPEELSLIQRDELEDKLAISVITSKSNSRNSEVLWQLNRRMAALRGGKKVTDETNPFGPAIITHAMQAAVSQLSIDGKVRIHIYKHLGKLFVLSFSKILPQLNDFLAAQGVLPNLRFSATQQPVAKGNKQQPNEEQTNENAADSSAESEASLAHQHELYSAIRELQSKTGPRQQTAGGVSFAGVPINGTGGSDTFSDFDYALALSAIQQSNASIVSAARNQPLLAETVEQKLFTQLQSQGSEDGRHKMTSEDADTVDLVGMIFRYMLDDPNINDAVKSILSHLHTPYLKLALMDKDFLDNHKHPARVLLNQMAELGGRWVKDEKDRNVLPKIKIIVETILKGYVDDASIFDTLLEDFSRFKEALEKRARMVEKRNTESQQGLERLELSRQHADDEIQNRLQQANIPAAIGTLLRKPWADFLSFNLLRHGDKSLTWEAALKVVDGVIWSVIPSQTTGSKEDFQRRQIDLETSVSEGLSTIGYDAEASKTLLASMHEAHELAYHQVMLDEAHQASAATEISSTVSTTTESPITQTISSSAENQTPQHSPANKHQDQATNTKNEQPHQKPVTTAKAKAKASKAPPQLSKEEQRMVNKLKDISFGTWFTFKDGETLKQLKLAWFSKVSSHYMFVDQSGIKQAVETQIDLAKGMVSGTIVMLPPNKKSFMERALEAVFEKLKLTG
jgi:hypothetical protein